MLSLSISQVMTTMINLMNRPRSANTSLQAEVMGRFGVLPNFFRLVPETPEITANLWGFAKFSYLDNPLPPLFKERLFVYLSRFCEVRYCIARHVGFLVGLGRPSGDQRCSPETPAQVLRLIVRPLPRGEELQSHLELLETCREPLHPLPASGTPTEEAVFACSTHVFLQTPQAARCQESLQRIFDRITFQHLIVFLAFVRTAHYWTKLHPELEFEDDIKELLAAHEALAECILNDPEAATCETTQVLQDELATLRRERALREDVERANQALRESELRYRLVGRAANEAIWDWNLATNQVTWNERVETLFGYPAEQVSASWREDRIHPDDRERVVKDIHAAIDGGKELWQDVYRFRRADGSYAEVFDRGWVVYETGRPVRMVGSLLDLSERKRAEEIHQTNLFLRTLVRSCPLAVVVIDPDAPIVRLWNPAAEQLFGYTEAEVVGQSIPIVPEENRGEGQTFRGLVAKGQTFSGEETYRRPKDGLLIHVSVSAAPLYDAVGGVSGLMLVYADIGERRRADQALKDADRRKDEFLATLAHELRNPLAPIRNALHILRLSSDREANERARSMMGRQLEQLVRLVDDLLDMSRISRGKLELRKQRVPLSAILSSAVETSRSLIDDLGHELTVAQPEQPIILDADLIRLAQVISNLLNNSAKYTDRCGHIQLTAERQGSDVVVSVKDSGIGIAADQLPRIFEMFSQVDRSLERSQGGLGVGLTLVKRLVEMHGGQIEAKSNGLGKGAEFIVRLPVVVDTAVRLPPSAMEKAPDPKSSRRILIVDDNRDSADSLATLMRIMGNDTRTAYDGLEGVTAAGEFRPAVVLLDIGLPKLNGYEACRRIRGEPWGKGVILIAVTGWGQEEDRRRSRGAGFDHHMVKPVDSHELMKLLAGLQQVEGN